MTNDGKIMLVLGGSGFIGRHVIQSAAQEGWDVVALARTETSASIISAAGGRAVQGDAGDPKQWLDDVADVDVIVDLVQPPRPKRVSRREMRRLSVERQSYTRAMVAALQALPADRQPRLVSVSGIDDLSPDKDGSVSDRSGMRATESGFNSIGIPVRSIIERSGINATFVYLGTVYGPAGPFGDAILPAIAEGKWRDFGGRSDRMILVHVEDAARGLVRIAGRAKIDARGRSYVLVDREPVAMKAFSAAAAALMDVKTPGAVPKWIASLVAGRPIVETTLHVEPVVSSFADLSEDSLAFPTYREGLPATLQALGRYAPSH